MNSNAHDPELPDFVLRMLGMLERHSGHIPPWRATIYILVLGLVLTAVVVVSVWQANAQRDRQDFESVSAQLRMQLQERLTNSQWKLSRAADEWARDGHSSGTARGLGFEPGDLRFMHTDDAPVTVLSQSWQLGADSQRVLADFWRDSVLSLTPFDGSLLSPALIDAQGKPFWLLVRAVDAPARESSSGRASADKTRVAWVLARLTQNTLLPPGAPHPQWAMDASLVSGRMAPAQMTLSLQSQKRFERRLMSVQHVAGQPGDAAMMLRMEGTPRPVGWRVAMARDPGIWIAGGFGLALTVGALHAYLLLISTRLRARNLAKQTTEALQRSESRTRAVVDTAPDAILTVGDDGKVQWCNQATMSIFGHSLESLEGQPLGCVIPSLESLRLPQWFNEQGVAGRVIGFETLGCRVDGTVFPIAVSARRAELDGVCMNTLFVRDTTDAKWAEHELLLRERALASSAEGIIITDMTLPGQPTIFVNTAFEKITGYEMHDILGQNCKVLQREDNNQPGIEAMRQAIAKGEACQVVVRNYRRDGTLFWNELTISPVRGSNDRVTHYVGVASDITDRMAAEQVLHLRTERLNAVFDLSPDGFVVLDKRGEVSIVNPAFERMTGLYAADLVGLTREGLESRLMALCSAAVEVADTDTDAPEAEPGEADGTMALSRKELLHLHSPCVRTLVRRIRHGGHDDETVMYFRDITQELEVDRMKSEFLSMAAHELRTPMASIYGFTELLLKRKFDDERRTDMLGTIHKQAHILINLINELLDLARIEARRGKDFKREGQPLQPLVESTVEGLLVHNDSRKVALSLPVEPIWVDVDQEKLSQAITNVLSNAYKYSPKGGSIELDVVSRSKEERIECGVRVRDQGLGMSPEHLARLFERFFRADTSGNIPGTGLGMTIVKEIVELHGGEVSVESELGHGTTVILWLPVAACTLPQRLPEPA
jgi:PAS domain S-box-containing protein